MPDYTNPGPGGGIVLPIPVSFAGSVMWILDVATSTWQQIQIGNDISKTINQILLNYPQGVDILIPAGTFIVASPIDFGQLAGNIPYRIKGAGPGLTILKQANGANMPSFVKATNPNQNVILENIRLDGNSLNNTGTIGIDGTNMQNLRCVNVHVVNMPGDGFHNVSFAELCLSGNNGGWGFFNNTWGLNAYNCSTFTNGSGGYSLYNDSILSSFKADGEPTAVYVPNGVYPDVIEGGAITGATVGSIGLNIVGSNPSAAISGIEIDMAGNNQTGIVLGTTTVNPVGLVLDNIVIRGRTSASGQTGINIRANRLTLQNFVITQIGGTGLVLTDGTFNLINRGQIYSTTTPISNVSSGIYGVNWIIHDVVIESFGLTMRRSKINIITGNYTADPLFDEVILANATGGAITITLPSANNTGLRLQIKKTDSSANAVTIAAQAGGTIEGSASISLTAQYQGVVVVAGGAAVWYRQ